MKMRGLGALGCFQRLLSAKQRALAKFLQQETWLDDGTDCLASVLVPVSFEGEVTLEEIDCASFLLPAGVFKIGLCHSWERFQLEPLQSQDIKDRLDFRSRGSWHGEGLTRRTRNKAMLLIGKAWCVHA